MDVYYRPAIELDAETIITQWISSTHRHHPYIKRYTLWNAHQESKRREIIEKLSTNLPQILIACNPERMSEIYGWCCFTKINSSIIIDYIYIDKQHRQKGLATDLFKEIGVSGKSVLCSDVSKYCIKIEEHYKKNRKPIRIYNVKHLIDEYVTGGTK